MIRTGADDSLIRGGVSVSVTKISGSLDCYKQQPKAPTAAE